MADDATGRDSDKFMLRLPDGMRDRLKAAAEANKRSMNAEIVARLESTLGAQSGSASSPDYQKTIEAVSDRIIERFELIALEKNLFPDFRPDLGFSYEDPESRQRKNVYFEYKTGPASALGAVEQIKKYAQFNPTVGAAIIIYDGGMISFDPNSGDEIEFSRYPEIVDMFRKINDIDLIDLRKDKEKRQRFLEAKRF